ncbi:MAG: hypothetical protein Tsb009_32140 [Planctomycetaceae bacterium]
MLSVSLCPIFSKVARLVKRIFLTLAIFSTGILIAAYVLGWSIDDPRVYDEAVQQGVAYHMLTAVSGLVFAVLVHAIVLTYFMGTGRWMEETRQVYHLSEKWQAESNSLKYRTLPWMAGALVMLILAGAFGAIADPASPAGAEGFGGISAATVHLLVATTAFVLNLVINLVEYQAIDRNTQLVQEVLEEVQRIRAEKGLPLS